MFAVKNKICLISLGGFFILLCIFHTEALAGNQYFETPEENKIENINFINGGFEEPNIFELNITLAEGAQFDLAAALSYKYNRLHMNIVPGWFTRPVDPADYANRWVEYLDMIMTGYDGGVVATPSHEGKQYAELNASVPGTLYQTVNTSPGQKVYWEFYHRGRYGEDIMEFMLNNVVIETAQSDHSAWKRYYGVYTIPDQQTKTEFAFVSVSATGNFPGGGNYLDGIRLFAPAFLELEKSVTTSGEDLEGTYALAGETVTYCVSITNTGEAETSRTVFSDILPDGIELDQDSVKITYTDKDGTEQDIDTTDLIFYDSTEDILMIEAGLEITDAVFRDDITGGEEKNTDAIGTRSIEIGATVTITFDAVVTGENRNIGDMIENQAKVFYNDLGFEKYNINAQGEIEDDSNVSEVVGFELRSWVDITLSKKVDLAAVTDQSFVFQISYQSEDLLPEEKLFYAEVVVLAGQLQGTTKIEQLRPGKYSVTELSANWRYSLLVPLDPTQTKILNNLETSWQPVWENKREQSGLVSGRNRAVNRLNVW